MTRRVNPGTSDVMPKSRLTHKALPVAVVIGLLLTLHLYSPPRIGLWANVFYNSLHVPVFGLIAVSLYSIFADRLSWRKGVSLAFVLTCALGVLSEVAQIATSRDASLQDLFADCLGAAGFLAIFLAVTPPRDFSSGRRVAHAGVGLLVLAFSLSPLITVSAAYLERNLQRPVIANVDGKFGRVLTRVQNAEYLQVPASGGEPAYARITFGGGPWPGVAFHDVWPQWALYEEMVLNVGVEGEDTLDIHLRVHDVEHRKTNAFTDRFNRSFKLSPGDHELRISLTDLRDAPSGRVMNLDEISEVIVFGDASNAGRSFKLYSIHLD